MTYHLPEPRFPRGRSETLRAAEAAAIALVLCALAGCAHNPPRAYGSPGASPRPETPWKPPAREIEKADELAREREHATQAPSIPPSILANIRNLTLADIVNVALANSTQTREAWALARAAAAVYGSARASYFPTIDGTASVEWQKSAFGGRVIPAYHSYFGGGTLSWLLFDFGGRSGAIESTRQSLFAADWTHNTAIQDVILEVELAYYDYFAAKALLAAQETTVTEMKTNLSAANDRHAAGVATIADVLQARTALSQATLVLETLQGEIQTTRGVLATAMGLPANVTYDVELPVGAPPLEETQKTVEDYLAVAERARPDLLAARAQALAAAAHLKSVRASLYPSISAGGDAGRYFVDKLSHGNFTYDFAVTLRIPFFAGGARRFNVHQAEALNEYALAVADDRLNAVTLQVWTSYYTLLTAEQRVRTSSDLMASAGQNQEVAAGRYKAGAGSILDLLVAQSALADARAQQVQARADWWIAVAQLAHDTGTLEVSRVPTGPGGETGANPNDTKGKP